MPCLLEVLLADFFAPVLPELVLPAPALPVAVVPDFGALEDLEAVVFVAAVALLGLAVVDFVDAELFLCAGVVDCAPRPEWAPSPRVADTSRAIRSGVRVII
jgi:hypothetical protein